MPFPLEMQCSSTDESDGGTSCSSFHSDCSGFSSLDADDIVSRLAVMRAQEEGPYQPLGDYLARISVVRSAAVPPRPRNRRCSRPVDALCRTKMVDWCYQVVDFCNFNREVVSVAFSYLDRYLWTPSGYAALLDRNLFQLACMAALYTAVKLNEPEVMEPKIIAGLSQGNYSEAEVAEMEADVLCALGWRMNPPTAAGFVLHLFALLPPRWSDGDCTSAAFDRAKFQAELFVRDYELCAGAQPSAIACAALLNAVAMEGMPPLPAEYTDMIGHVLSVDAASEKMALVRAKLWRACAQCGYDGHSSEIATPASSSVASATDDGAAEYDGSASAMGGSAAETKVWICHSSSPRCVSRESSARHVDVAAR